MPVSTSKLARRLSDINRLHVYQLRKPQSVAEHSFNMAMMANNFYDLLEKYHPEMKRNRDFLVRLCLYHDLPEAVTGDIPWTVKQYINAAELKLAEVVMLENVLGPNINAPDVRDSIWSAVGHPEEKLLAFFDMLELFITVLGEVELGNADLEPVLDNAANMSWAIYNMEFSPEIKGVLAMMDEVGALMAFISSAQEE